MGRLAPPDRVPNAHEIVPVGVPAVNVHVPPPVDVADTKVTPAGRGSVTVVPGESPCDWLTVIV